MREALHRTLASDGEAIQVILEASGEIWFTSRATDFVLAMDAASSEWKSDRKGEYLLRRAGKEVHLKESVEHWKSLCEKYPILPIEGWSG